MTHPPEPPGPPRGAGVPGPAGAQVPVPVPEVVEWRAGPPSDGLVRLAGWRSRRSRWSRWSWRLPAAWPLAGLGAAAGLASMIGDWQLTTQSFMIPSVIEDGFVRDELSEVAVGVDSVGAWGMVWLIGAAGLAICVWLTLFGLVPARAYTRSIGLATAGVLLGLLVAAAVSLSTDLTAIIDQPAQAEQERRPGWGLFAAFAAVLLLGAALRQARVPPSPARPSRPPAGPRSTSGHPSRLATSRPATPATGRPATPATGRPAISRPATRTIAGLLTAVRRTWSSGRQSRSPDRTMTGAGADRPPAAADTIHR